MNVRDFGVGLAVTSLTWFVWTGIAFRLLPVGAALAAGTAAWLLSAIAFVRAMKSAA